MSPIDLTLVELLAAFRGKSLSPLDYWDALEARIAVWEPHIKALYHYRPEAARREAAAATERWRKGEPHGALDGVPVTIKEMIATEGVPVPMGSAVTILAPAAADAPPAARLREAGAIIFAKTTAPDIGMLSSGISSFHGTTRNPWDLGCNPGGSSSGAGAAGAAGYGPLHIGTDIGGSVRLPAAWCGLVGFKPNLGRIPIDPSYPMRCAGPMTRSVADAAFAMRFLSQPDARDGMSLPPAAIEWSDLEREVKGLRIGLMLEAGAGMTVEPEVTAAVTRAAEIFAAAGAVVEPVDGIATPEILTGIDDFFRARAWADLGKLPPERLALLLPYIRAWAEVGASISGARAIAGFNQTMALRQRAASLFRRFDAVLSPTTPVVAFPAENASPFDDPARPFDHIAFTIPWNGAENPAISVNCAASAGGMPIGLQIIGPRFNDLGVLQLAKWFEDRRGPLPAWPAPPA